MGAAAITAKPNTGPPTMTGFDLALLLITLLAAGAASIGGIGMAIQMQDAQIADDEFALPDGAATTYSTGIDLGIAASSPNDFLAQVELELTCPTLAVGAMADADTLLFALITDDALPLDASSTVLIERLVTLTGAGGVGATGFTKKVRIPTDVLKYVGWKAIKTGTGDASGVEATSKAKF
jgi:hypothetical protein